MGQNDMVFTAIWTPIFTISFDVDGGSSKMYEKSVLQGMTFEIPSYNGIREGLVFVGWSDGINTYLPGYKIVNVRADLYLKAVWIEPPNTVYYDLDGGSGYVPSQTLKEGAEFTISSYDGTKTGFIFIGWSDGKESYAPGDICTMGSEDITFKAVWEPKLHTVSYDLVGGSGSVSSATVAEDGQFVLASYSGTKAGFAFGGWTDGKGTYRPGDIFTMGASDIVFKAVWNANTEYTVSYDLDGGSGSVSSVKCREGFTIFTSLYDGTKAGFAFGGWQYGGTYYSAGSSFTMPACNVTFTAVWNKSTLHTVSYDLVGGSGSVSGCTVKEGVGFETAEYDGTKAGFTFGGWQFNGTLYAPGTPIVMGTTDMAFTAVWDEKIIHVVSYDLVGGSGSIGNQYVAEGETFALQTYLGTKIGCTFAGWQCNGISYQPGVEVTMGMDDMVFVADWVQTVTHYVYYDLDGGSGSITVQAVEEGKVFTITSEKPTKDGSSFAGWSSAGSVYSSGATVAMGNLDITFEAVWVSESDASLVNVYIVVAVLAVLIIIAAAFVMVRRNV